MNDVRIRKVGSQYWNIEVNGEHLSLVTGRAEDALAVARARVCDASIWIYAPDIGPATTIAAQRMGHGKWLLMRR